MTQVRAGDRLTAEDAAFLYLEKDEMPLHIGSVSTFDGVIPFEPLLEYVESRLPLIPRYRQRLVTPPFHVGHPTWEDDPDFDLRKHVFLTTLKRGTETELRKLAGNVFGRVMDRTKPLWDLLLVHGLDGGRCGLIARVHHCLADGVSGAGLMNVMLNAEAFSPPARAKPKRDQRRPFPGAETSLADALASSYSEMVNRVLAAQSATLKILEGLASEQNVGGFQELARMIPGMLTPVERLPFNRPLAGPRRIAWARYSLDEVKAIKNSRGATVNDVVLTAVTRALRALAARRGQDLRAVVAAVIVTAREAAAPGELGNRVGVMPVRLPAAGPGGAELGRDVQLGAIAAITRAHKTARRGSSAGLLRPVFRSLSLLHVLPWAINHQRLVNVFVTNLRGPAVRQRLAGAEVTGILPITLIAGNVTLSFAVLSYAGLLSVVITADPGCHPDYAELAALLQAELDGCR